MAGVNSGPCELRVRYRGAAVPNPLSEFHSCFLDVPLELEVLLVQSRGEASGRHSEHLLMRDLNVAVDISVVDHCDGLLPSAVPSEPCPVTVLQPVDKMVRNGMAVFEVVIRDGPLLEGRGLRFKIKTVSGVSTVLEAVTSELFILRKDHVVFIQQPPYNWYKDEGGKNHCMDVKVAVRRKSNGKPCPGVPLRIVLLYENLQPVVSKEQILLLDDRAPMTNAQGELELKVKIGQVSQRHEGKSFVLCIGPDATNAPVNTYIAAATSVPIKVLSKRKGKKIGTQRDPKEEDVYARQGDNANATETLLSLKNSQFPINTNLSSRSSMQNRESSTYSTVSAISAVSGAGEADDSMRDIPESDDRSFPQHVYDTLRGLEWTRVGFELHEDGSIDQRKPLYKCMKCQRVRGVYDTDVEHAPGCQIAAVLERYPMHTAAQAAH